MTRILLHVLFMAGFGLSVGLAFAEDAEEAFINSYFGIRLPLPDPDDWPVLTNRELAMSLSEFMQATGVGAKELRQRCGSVLLGISHHSPTNDTRRFNSNLMIFAESLTSQAGKIADAEGYLKAVATVQENLGLDELTLQKPEEVVVGGKKFHAQDSRMLLGETSVRQRILVTIIRNHFFVMHVSAGSETEFGELMGFVETADFSVPEAETLQGTKDSVFLVHDDDTVTDTRTGLMWQAADSGQTMAQNDGKVYVGDLDCGHRDDWRLPSYEELEGLYESLGSKAGGNENRCVTPFQWTGTIYWSGSEGHERGSLEAMNFENREHLFYQPGAGWNYCYVRAVRGDNRSGPGGVPFAEIAPLVEEPPPSMVGRILRGAGVVLMVVGGLWLAQAILKVIFT